MAYIHTLERAGFTRAQAEAQAGAYSGAMQKLIAWQDEKAIRDLASMRDLEQMELRQREQDLKYQAEVREAQINADAQVAVVKADLDARIMGAEKRLDTRITEVKEQLAARITEVEKRLDARITEAEKRLKTGWLSSKSGLTKSCWSKEMNLKQK